MLLLLANCAGARARPAPRPLAEATASCQLRKCQSQFVVLMAVCDALFYFLRESGCPETAFPFPTFALHPAPSPFPCGHCPLTEPSASDELTNANQKSSSKCSSQSKAACRARSARPRANASEDHRQHCQHQPASQPAQLRSIPGQSKTTDPRCPPLRFGFLGRSEMCVASCHSVLRG